MFYLKLTDARAKNDVVAFSGVSGEIKEFFTYIMRYTPQTIDLNTKFKPFIPEYIPAVGDIDAFIKVSFQSVKSLSNNILTKI